ncbi:hypothetical protein ABE957_15230 [Halomonas sp. CS7]|uniref:Uncharacterized protein n=1 Tax=Halomonas pelophila TaxID=3151122 RepID=A0ABV1N8G3_9GAMM
MADFASRIDIAIVGNSGAQLWLLIHGVPVIHVPGFDQHGYDRYGYVHQAFAFGVYMLEDLSLDDVRYFYSDIERHWLIMAQYTTIIGGKKIDGLEVLSQLVKC